MNDSVCPNCNHSIPPDSPGGVCPKCVFAAASDRPRATPYVTTAATNRARQREFIAPTPEALTNHFEDLVVEELIGHGGMGAVYRARQKRLDRVVALKILSPALGNDPTFTERFAREARTLAKLTHPNIVMVFEFGNIDDMCFLVMELVDGVNLRDAIRNKTITAEQALQIVPYICEALQFAHDEGVVHRDIKPENILLNKRGQVKIADFGLAKMLDRDPVEFSLTGTHQIVGTRNYMAPEQIEKPETVDHRADIYSLGVVFYELLTGELPIGRFANPSEKSSINANLDEIVMKTLEKEPDRRYQQASEFKTAVETAGEIPRRVEQPKPAKPPRQTEVVQQLAANHSPVSPIQKPVTKPFHVPFSIGDIHGGFAAAYGIAKLSDRTLSLEFEVRDEILGSVKSGPKQVDIDVAKILSAGFKPGMFSGTIRVCTDGVAVANAVPNSKQGVFTIKVAKADYDLADKLVSALQTLVGTLEAVPPQKSIVPNKVGAMEKAQAAVGYVANRNLDNSDDTSETDGAKTTLEKISGPANALAVIAILNLVFNSGHIFRFVADMIRKPQITISEMFVTSTWDSKNDFASNLANIFTDFIRNAVNPFDGREWLLTLIVSILALVAANHMKQFKSYKFCFAIALVMLVPLYSLYFLGMAFAIWTIVVLSDQRIREEFDKRNWPSTTQKHESFRPSSTERLIKALCLFLFLAITTILSLGVVYVALTKQKDSPAPPPSAESPATDGSDEVGDSAKDSSQPVDEASKDQNVADKPADPKADKAGQEFDDDDKAEKENATQKDKL